MISLVFNVDKKRLSSTKCIFSDMGKKNSRQLAGVFISEIVYY